MSPVNPIPGVALMQAHGIRLYVPPAWSGRIFRQTALVQAREGPGPVIVHGANFALPLDMTSGMAGAVHASMRPADVFFMLVNWVPDSVIVPGEGLYAAQLSGLTVEPRMYSPATVRGGLPGMVGMQYFFTVGRRPMMFYSALGSADLAKAGVVELNAVIKGMEVASTVDSTDFRTASSLVGGSSTAPPAVSGAAP